MSPEFSSVLQRLQRDLENESVRALVKTRASDWDDYLRRFHLIQGQWQMLEAMRSVARKADDDGD